MNPMSASTPQNAYELRHVAWAITFMQYEFFPRQFGSKTFPGGGVVNQIFWTQFGAGKFKLCFLDTGAGILFSIV
jgi:hypothetical protein